MAKMMGFPPVWRRYARELLVRSSLAMLPVALAVAGALLLPGEARAQEFRRGDINADGRFSTCDYTLNFLFLDGPAPRCRDAADADDHGALNLTDPVHTLNFLFLGGSAPPCLAACDANADGAVIGQVSDAVYILQFNFTGGPAPPSPFPDCGAGASPRDSALGCRQSSGACR